MGSSHSCNCQVPRYNISSHSIWSAHDDVIEWKHFPRYWPFVRGIHRFPVNSPHRAQWRGVLMFSLIFDLRLNNRLSKQSWGWWFETLWRLLWRHRNEVDCSDSNLGRWCPHCRNMCLQQCLQCVYSVFDDLLKYIIFGAAVFSGISTCVMSIER